MARCKKCKVAVWSNYSEAGEAIRFVRMGEVVKDAEGNEVVRGVGDLEPDVHIFTGKKVPWVVIPEGKKVFEEFYQLESTWRPEALERMGQLRKGEGRGKG